MTTWGPEPAEIVLLHDGLGSVEQFNTFPAALHQATGKSVMAYDRPGHGQSTPVPDRPWPVTWLQTEADRLMALQASLGIEQPTVVGHSDGGSIALVHAARYPDAVASVVAIASHCFVEDICFDKITGMRDDARVWAGALKAFHRDPAAIFEAWSGVWVSDAFRRWDIRPDLGSIVVPTLVMQGSEDEFATPAMVNETVAAVGANAAPSVIEGGRHLLPQRSETEVVEAITSFLSKLA